MDGRERLWHHVSQYTERTYPLYAEKKSKWTVTYIVSPTQKKVFVFL